MKKIICLLTAITVLLAVCACKDEDTQTTAAETEGYVMTDVSDVRSPMSINGEDVPYSLFRYYYAAVRYSYDYDNSDYWRTHELTDIVRDETVELIRRCYAVQNLCNRYGIKLTDAEKSQVTQVLMSELLSYYEDEAEYLPVLDKNYSSLAMEQYIAELSQLDNKLFEYLTGDSSGPRISSDPELVQRYVYRYVIQADHILILNDDGDDVNENETLIKELRTRIDNGEDFQTLKEQYSEDTSTSKSEYGYYIAEGDINKIFSETAFSLQPGQISDVIEAPYGYHIIRRLPLDDEYIQSALTTDLLELYRDHMMELILDKEIDEQTVIFDDSIYTYTPTNLK